MKLDEDAGAVVAFSPGPSKESGEGLGGKEAYAAVGDVVSRDTEFERMTGPVLDLPADHSFARHLVLLAKAGDLKAAGLISDEVGAFGGDEDRGTAVDDERGVARGGTGEAADLVDGVDEGRCDAARG